MPPKAPRGPPRAAEDSAESHATLDHDLQDEIRVLSSQTIPSSTDAPDAATSNARAPGISALGTKLRDYEAERREVEML